MNITVRVYTKQAQAALLAMDRQLTTTSRAASTSSYGAANMAKATRSMKAFGTSVQWAGYQLMHAFTLPILAAAGAAVKYELANEKAMTNVKKVYGDAALAAKDNGKTIRNELSALRKEFESLSDVYGVNQTDVINIAEKWAAAGVSGRALGTAVQTTLKEMVIGDLDATKATTSLISIQAQYGASAKEMQKIMAALNTTENITAVSTADLIDAFERSASVAALAGVDYKHLAAIVAAIVPAAGSAAKAGNAIKTIFTDLLVPTVKAANALKALGINVDATSWTSKSATERLQELSTKFEKLDGNQKTAVSNFIAGKYQISRFAQMMHDLSTSVDSNGKVLGINAKNLGNYGKVLDSTRNDAGNLKIAQGELNTVLSSDPQKLKQVWVILKNEAADAVKGLIPFIIQFVTLLAGLMKSFSNSSPVFQKWFGIFLIGLAALGPVLLYLAAMSKLIHFIALAFSGAFKVGKWFLGLFTGMGAEEKALLSLEKRVVQLRKTLLSLTTPSAFEKLTAEAAVLETQIAELTAVVTENATVTTNANVESAIRSAEARDAQLTAAEAAVKRQTIIEAVAAANSAEAWNTAAIAEMAASDAVTANAVRNAATVTAANSAAAASAARSATVSSASTVGAGAASSAAAAGAGGAAAATAGAGAAAARTESIWAKILRGTKAFGGKFFNVLNVALLGAPRLITSVLSVVPKLFTNPYALAIMAVIALFLIFRHQITAIMKDVWKGIVNAGMWIWSGLKTIGGFFADAGNMIVSAISALPRAFVTVFNAVVDIVSKAALQVYDLFSYLNPFAHHSPSLVENVTKGHAVIRDEHAKTATSAQDHAATTAQAHNAVRKSVEQNLGSGSSSPDAAIVQSTKDLLAFKNATKNLFPDDFHKNAAQIKKDLPALTPLVNALVADYTRLNAQYDKLGAQVKAQTAVVASYQAQLDRLNATLDAQTKKLTALQAVQSAASDKLDAAKQRVQDFANTQIKGYGAMDDAIFANTQAQNKLQLQMLRMGDATGGIDKAQAKYAALAGEIEKLNGERSNLQQAGAGSDVLGGYDKQINGMKGQQTAISSTVAQYGAMNDELTALQNKAQELDLEKSLKFDPLTRQIDKAANAMKELPFDQIMAGIQRNQAAVNTYQTAYDKATVAVNKQQKVVDALTVSRDAASAKVDAEQKKLDTLTAKYNQVGDAISAVVQAMQDLSSQADKKTKIKTPDLPLGPKGDLVPATGKGSLGREGGLGDQTAGINADIKKQMDSIAGLSSKMDLFGGLKKKFSGIGAWIKKWIWDEPAKWGDWITAHVADLGKMLWGWVTSGWNNVISFLKSVPGLLGKMLSALPGVVGRGLLELTHKFFWLLGWLVGFFLVRLPATIARAGGLLFVFFSKLAVKVVEGFAKGMEAFYRFLISLPGRTLKFLERLPGMTSRAGVSIALGLYEGVVSGAKALLDFFENLPSRLYSFFLGAKDWLATSGLHILLGLVNGLYNGAKWVWKQIKGFVNDFLSGFMSALGIKGNASAKFSKIGGTIIHGLVDGLKAAAKFLWDFFTGLPALIISYLAKAGSWLYNGGKALIGSWNGGGFIGGIHDAWDGLINWLLKWDVKLAGYVIKAGTWLYKGGKKLIGSWNGGGFIGGIHSAWTWLINWLLKWDVKLAGYVIKAGDWLKNGGKKLIGSWNGTGFLGGIHVGWDNLVTWIEGRPAWFKAKFVKAGDWLKNAGKDLIGTWNGIGILGGIHVGWDNLVTWIEGRPAWFKAKFAQAGTWLKQAGKDIGNGLVNALRDALSGIGNLFMHPVRTVVGVVNTVIGLINDVINGVGKVAKLIGMGFHIKAIPTVPVPKGFAQGGELPSSVVGHGFKVNRARAIVGEGNPNFPEYVIPTDPRYRSRAKDLWASVGKDIQMLAGGGRIGPNPGLNETGASPIPNDVGTGGITGGITDSMVNYDRSESGRWIANFFQSEKGWTEKVGSGIDNVIKSVGGWITSTALEAIWFPVKKIAEAGLNKVSVPIIKGVGESWLNDVDSWINNVGQAQDKKKAPSFGFGYNVDRFAPVAMEGFLRAQHTGSAFDDLVASAKILPDILHRLNQESGGYPNAINLTDSNAQAGIPSKGIMQVIPPTFASYRTNSLPNNIWDPRANMYAGLNYAKHAYGSIDTAMNQPGGYAAGGILPMFANGGIASKPTAGVFGEAGHEVLAPLDPLWNRLDRIENNSASNMQSSDGGTTIIINGNLEFPNIKSDDDAESFVRNLKRAVSK